jgi:two-component system, NarL family, sensor histidine kinase BarA
MVAGRLRIEYAWFDLQQTARFACEALRPQARAKRLDLVAQLEPLRIEADEARVYQVLWNLLSNAIKFTPDGGRIMVAAERDDLGELRLTVADTGIGISVEDQQLVFEKFRQATSALPDGDAMTREYSGTGLGLSIVRELCRLLGGDVSLESELGKGSTFTVRLPWRLEEMPRLDTQLREDLEVLSRTAPVIGGPAATIAGVESQGSGV